MSRCRRLHNGPPLLCSQGPLTWCGTASTMCDRCNGFPRADCARSSRASRHSDHRHHQGLPKVRTNSRGAFVDIESRSYTLQLLTRGRNSCGYRRIRTEIIPLLDQSRSTTHTSRKPQGSNSLKIANVQPGKIGIENIELSLLELLKIVPPIVHIAWASASGTDSIEGCDEGEIGEVVNKARSISDLHERVRSHDVGGRLRYSGRPLLVLRDSSR